MIQDQAKIEEFQLNVQQELSPIADYDTAYDTLTRIKKDAANELNATDEEIGELMELHWGNCNEIDDALCEVFPQQFDGR